MNGHENILLQQISNKLDKVDDKIAETNANVAATQADVANLVGWSQQMEHKMENLDGGGCAKGRVLEERITNINRAQNEQIADVKKELNKKATKGDAVKISGSIAAASSTVLAAVAQALFAVFK